MDEVRCKECTNRQGSFLVELFRRGSVYLDQDWLCSWPCLEESLVTQVARSLAYPIPEVDFQHRIRIGTILVQKGLINSEQLGIAVERQATEGGTIGSHILSLGFCSESQLTSALSEQQGVPWVGDVRTRSDSMLDRILPRKLCEDFQVFPFDFDEKTQVLFVAARSPVKIALVHMLRKMVGYQVQAFMVADASFSKAFEGYLSRCSPAGEVVLRCSREAGLIAHRLTGQAQQFRARRLRLVAYDGAFWVRMTRGKKSLNIIVALERSDKVARPGGQKMPSEQRWVL